MADANPSPEICLGIATELGEFAATYTKRGLSELRFPSNTSAQKGTARSSIPHQVCKWHRITVAAVNAILAGRGACKLPPLDWSVGTPFQQSVWRAMLAIPPHETRSYGEIAHAVGRPRAVRAVGAACGANPIPVLVPCHRVLAARQKLGGFSSGLDWKMTLLKREGVSLI